MSLSKQVSLHGRRAYLTKDDQLVGRGGLATGGDGVPSIVLPSATVAAVFEDFLVPLLQAGDTGVPIGSGAFRQVTGDTGHGSLNVASATNGVFRLFNTPSVTAAAVAAAGKGIAGALQWKGNQGPGSNQGRLRYAARVKVFPDDGGSAISRTVNRLHAFVGLTDIATYEFPAYDTGAGVIANATDYCGFMLAAGGDTGWSLISAGQVVALGVGPTVNTWDTLELEYIRGAGDTGGRVVAYVNGVARGKIDSPFGSTIPMAACVYAWNQDTGKQALDIDFVNVSAPRDTGQ